MRRYGIDRFGDMAPMANGEYYEARDVEGLEDELEAARKELIRLRAGLETAREHVALAAKRSSHQNHNQFGYVHPDRARGFLTGVESSITVTRSRTDTNLMPVFFIRGPSKYSLPDGKRPQVGTRVWVNGNQKAWVRAYSKRHDEAVIVKIEGQDELAETINWSLVSDKTRNAGRRSDVYGEIKRFLDRDASEADRAVDAVEPATGG